MGDEPFGAYPVLGAFPAVPTVSAQEPEREPVFCEPSAERWEAPYSPSNDEGRQPDLGAEQAEDAPASTEKKKEHHAICDAPVASQSQTHLAAAAPVAIASDADKDASAAAPVASPSGAKEEEPPPPPPEAPPQGTAKARSARASLKS